MASVRFFRPAASMALALAVFLAAVGGCTAPEVQEAADKEDIQAFLEQFLPALGSAYAERDAYLIRDYVAPKEIARVAKRIDELAARGQVYAPTVRTITIESVNVWNNSNAFVSTLEVWDVERRALGSGTVIGSVLEQPNRVKYQMKRDESGWRVLYRTIQE